MNESNKRQMPSRLMVSLTAASLVAVFLLVFASSGICETPASEEGSSAPQFIAYYFHTNKRCGTCKRIEQWAEEAVTTHLKDELAAGRLQWKALNVQQAENEHFIHDFQLYSKSVIIAEYRDGKPVRWDNLKDVWRLNRNKPEYLEYVAGGIKAFMEKK